MEVYMLVRTVVMVAALTAGLAEGLPLQPSHATVDGSMTVAGKVSKLGHVRAFAKKVFGRPAVLLVFSDVELSAADADNDTKLSELANAGGLHAMGILTGDDPAGKKQAISNEIYDQGLHGRMSIGGQDTFEARKGTDKWASGRLYLATPKKFESGVTFTYDVTFDAPIEP
jgi:hypothetical protein